MSNLRLYTDGGARGNPGPSACGFVVYDMAGLPAEASAEAGNILEKCGNYLGEMTNNQAEYQGLIQGLSWLVEHRPDSGVEIFMDSQLIVNQIKGSFRVKNPQLLPLYQQAHSLLKKLSSWQISHLRRERNTVADSLVNLALDRHLGL